MVAVATTPRVLLGGQVRLLQGELARLSLLWEEAWHATLSELQVTGACWSSQDCDCHAHCSLVCRRCFVLRRTCAAGCPLNTLMVSSQQDNGRRPNSHIRSQWRRRVLLLTDMAPLLRRQMCRGGWWRCRPRQPAWRSGQT